MASMTANLAAFGEPRKQRCMRASGGVPRPGAGDRPGRLSAADRRSA